MRTLRLIRNLFIVIGLYWLIGMMFSCTSEEIQPSFYKYYQTFKNEANQLNVNLPDKTVKIIYGKLVARRAECRIKKRSIEVVINSDFWNIDESVYDIKLEATIFHELGHGLLNRGHLTPIEGIQDESLMTAPSMHHDYINRNEETREYYLRELFGLNE